jgi:ATP-dependent protease HslVU (ClpYQ) peptidase subunit
VTCIIAIETDGQVVMGGDRMGSNGHTGEPVSFPKIFQKDNLLIGYCGSFRMGQLLQHALDVPLKTLTDDVDRWVSIDLMQAMRKAYKENDWDNKRDDVAEAYPILLAVSGRCYEIQADFSYLRSMTGEYVTGSGSSYAQGSMHSTRGKASAKKRIEMALQAAAEYVVSVAGPFDFYVSKAKVSK